MGSGLQMLFERLTFDKQESTCVVILSLFYSKSMVVFYAGAKVLLLVM